MHLNKLFLVIVCIFLANVGIAQLDHNASFATANDLFEEAKYDDAIALYESILQTGLKSPELHLNLGNAYAKTNKVGNAVLHYEKGLKFNANHPSLLKNLSLIKKRVDSEIFEVQAFWPVRVWRNFVGLASSNVWAIIQLLILAALVFIWGARMFNRLAWSDQRYRLITRALILDAILIGLVLYASINYSKSDVFAIVLEEIQLMSGPDDRSNSGTNIVPGEKIKILDDFGEWKKVELLNQDEGFVKLDKIGII